MTVLIELKEKLKEFYGSCSGIVLPIVKFLLALAVFRGINSNLGYLKMLNCNCHNTEAVNCTRLFALYW